MTNRRQFMKLLALLTPLAGLVKAGTPNLVSAKTHSPAKPKKRTVKFYLSEIEDFLIMECPGLKPSHLKVRWICQQLLVKDDAKLLRKFFQTKGLSDIRHVYLVSRGCDSYGPWKILEERKCVNLS